VIGRDRILEVLNAAVAGASGDEAEVVATVGRSDMSRCANSVIHQNVSVEDAQVAARVIADGRTGRASTHGFSPEAVARALTDAAELARFAPRDPGYPGLPGPSPLPEVRSHVEGTGRLEPADRARALRTVFEAARGHGLGVAGAYRTSEKELAVVNTRGVAAYAPLTSASTNLVVSGEESSGYASGLSRDAADLDFERLAAIAIRKCLDGVRPLDLEPGTYEVILEPAAMAELMEWMAFTCFSARGIHEKTSALAGKLGEPLLGPQVTLYDDGTEDAGMPTPFDFEGQPKRRVDLIEKGVARAFGTDSVWAARTGRENTAHAVLPSSEDSDPVPMNLFFEPGTVSAAEMPARVERGLLVTRFHYVNGFLDTRRALMTGMTRDGTFLIENGRVKGAVGNLRFTQSLVEALNDVRAISRERVPVASWWSATTDTGAITMPTLHLGRFHFSGRTERG
jgi:PmbA protein